MRGGCSSQVEAESGIGPFLQGWSRRNEYDEDAQNLCESDDRHEVERVAEMGHGLDHVGLVGEMGESGEGNDGAEEAGRDPVGERFAIQCDLLWWR